jgi:methyltransferase
MSRVPLLALVAVLAMMGVELRISQRNEKRLRGEGAIEPPDDVYQSMRFVYPLCFIGMAAEGWLRGASPHLIPVAGLLVLLASKALKTWVIVSLGSKWSFHVLVRPRHRLVTRGPYRYLRHPNYLAIVGEIVGMALLVGASITGVISLGAMGFLLRRRITVEERALGLRA